MSFRNPPENSHEERAVQGRGSLRGVFESRMASQRKFFAGPSAVPSPNSSKGPEIPEGPDGQVSRAAETGGLPDLTHAQSPVPEVIAASEQTKLLEKISPGTEPPGDWPPSGAMRPRVRREESSVTLVATGEEIENAEEWRPVAAAETEPPESNRYQSLERHGSYRYKAEGIDVLFGWRRDESSVSAVPAGTVAERTVNPPSGVGLAGMRSGGAAGPQPVRGPETASLPADFDHHEARVHDISQTGLSLIVDRLPPNNRDLWIGVKGTWPIVWSCVVLRSLSEPHPGRFMLRLSFKESCPYGLFELAVPQMKDARTAT